jgi:hypothetical protein
MVKVAYADSLLPIQENTFLFGSRWFSKRIANSKNFELKVRILLVKIEHNELLVVNYDLASMSQNIENRIRREIEKTFCFKDQNVVIVSAHQHTTPDTIGLFGGISKQTINNVVLSTIACIRICKSELRNVDVYFSELTDTDNGLFWDRRNSTITEGKIQSLYFVSENNMTIQWMNISVHPILYSSRSGILSRDLFGLIEDSYNKETKFIFSLYPCGDLIPSILKNGRDINGYDKLILTYKNQLLLLMDKMQKNRKKIKIENVSTYVAYKRIKNKNLFLLMKSIWSACMGRTAVLSFCDIRVLRWCLDGLTIIFLPCEPTKQAMKNFQKRITYNDFLFSVSLSNTNIGYVLTQNDYDNKKHLKVEEGWSYGKHVYGELIELIGMICKRK